MEIYTIFRTLPILKDKTHAANSNTTHQKYICKTKKSISQINIYDIYYLEIEKHNITIHTNHGTYEKYGALSKELKALSSYGFVKCTQSCIVSLNKIKTINYGDIILINDVKLHMSRKYASQILIVFSQHKPVRLWAKKKDLPKTPLPRTSHFFTYICLPGEGYISIQEIQVPTAIFL